MTKEQAAVLAFHQKFKLTNQSKPTFPSMADFNLRVSLIAEELKEFSEAHSFVDVADALGDLLYVVLGAAVTYGIDLEPVFNEIHRSNMSKLWTHQEVDDYQGTDLAFIAARPPEGDRAWLAKRTDGKVIKSPSYSPADLKAVIEAQL